MMKGRAPIRLTNHLSTRSALEMIDGQPRRLTLPVRAVAPQRHRPASILRHPGILFRHGAGSESTGTVPRSTLLWDCAIVRLWKCTIVEMYY